MNFFTEITIDVSYEDTYDFDLDARFKCNPDAQADGTDEITVEFSRAKGKKSVSELTLTLTPEQCKEFMWALQKMLDIAKEYHTA
jgi:hypothetical protein